MADITRHQSNEKLSRVVVHGGTVYLSGLTADDKSTDTQSQTRQILAKADLLLASVGSDRSKLLLTQIYLRDTAEFDTMNRAWIDWLDGAAPPARITVGADFALPEIRVEILFTAAI
ncbi:RidA family protein [Paracoccus pantotrophus]|uniref:RidA family protein n=1 Tax=Paracoccus pantotrophus TaxID=82367 RepID=UPI000E0945EE|nr:RidA family protein [Paracoccus pantotrophus]RDD95289.1 RidA family protein [Paracoccus pantotrophus]WGR64180.1 RidA family protein [Paracoccus pantotrophus]